MIIKKMKECSKEELRAYAELNNIDIFEVAVIKKDNPDKEICIDEEETSKKVPHAIIKDFREAGVNLKIYSNSLLGGYVDLVGVVGEWEVQVRYSYVDQEKDEYHTIAIKPLFDDIIINEDINRRRIYETSANVEYYLTELTAHLVSAKNIYKDLFKRLQPLVEKYGFRGVK